MLFNVQLNPANITSGAFRTWWNENEEESLTIFNAFYDTDWLMCYANVTSMEKMPNTTEWQINTNIAIDSRNYRNSSADIEEHAGFLLSGGLLFNAVNEDW